MRDSGTIFDKLYAKMNVLNDALVTVHKELLQQNDSEALAAEEKFVDYGNNEDDYAMRLLSLPFLLWSIFFVMDKEGIFIFFVS